MRLPPLKTEKAWHFSSWSVIGMKKSNGEGVSWFHFSQKYFLVCPCNIQGEPGCSTASLASFGHDLDRQTRLRTFNEAIALHWEARRLLPAPHPDRYMSLNNLANILDTRFSQTSQIKDIDEAIALHREALGLLPAPHPDRSMSLNNLDAVLYRRFSQTGQIEDVDEAVALPREAPTLLHYGTGGQFEPTRIVRRCET
jgi:hypothetical protein